MLKRLIEEAAVESNFRGIVLHEDIEGVGAKIGKKLGVICDGFWEEMKKFAFTDPKTKSSFTAKDEHEANVKLKSIRAKFGYA